MVYLSVEFFYKKAFCIFFKFLHNMFWGSCCKWLENNLWYHYCFKNNNFPFQCKSSLILHNCKTQYFCNIPFFVVREVSNISNLLLIRSIKHIPQSATWAPLRTPIPTISVWNSMKKSVNHMLYRNNIL